MISDDLCDNLQRVALIIVKKISHPDSSHLTSVSIFMSLVLQMDLMSQIILIQNLSQNKPIFSQISHHNGRSKT